MAFKAPKTPASSSTGNGTVERKCISSDGNSLYLFTTYRSPFSVFNYKTFIVDGYVYNTIETFLCYSKAALYRNWLLIKDLMDKKSPKVKLTIPTNVKTMIHDRHI